MDLSIVIVSFNTRDVTRKCLDAIRRHPPGFPFEVIVVDNASQDGSADMVAQEFPWVRLILLHENLGFAGGNNEGIRTASGRYVLLLNSDAFIAEGVLHSTVSFMDSSPAAGVLGCRLSNPDGSLQPSARMLPSILNKALVLTGLAARYPKSRFFGRADFSWWDHAVPLRVGWVVGAFFLVRMEVFNDVGLLDERYFLYSEEIDFCRSARRYGWDVIFFPHASVVHLGGMSASSTGGAVSRKGKQLTIHRIRSELRYYRKWHGLAGVLAASLVEVAWRALVLLRNLPGRSPEARNKREEAGTIIRLVIAELVEGRAGKVLPPSPDRG